MRKLAAWFLAAVVLLFVGAAVAQVRSSQRIAFVTLEGRVATVAPEGTALRVLTEPGTRFQFPAWSPDGFHIAAIGSDRQAGSVYVVADAQDPQPAALYRSRNERPVYLYWSPDGATVSFIANHARGLGLHLATPGGEASRLLATGQPFYWDWAQDSQEILIHTGFAGADARLGFTGVEADDLESNLATPGFFQAPGISASGDYIAYGEVAGAGGRRLVVRAEPGIEGVATSREVPHRGLVAFGWSPTDDKLAFISPPNEAPHYYGPLRLLNAETGLLEPLTDDIVLAFFWSPDGRHIAYLTLGPSGGQDFAGVEPPVAPSASVQGPRGNLPLLNLSLIDVEEKSERFLATVVPGPLYLEQFLPFFDQYALSHRVWSPAGDALVMPVVDRRGVPQVAVIGLDGRVVPIAEGLMPFWNNR